MTLADQADETSHLVVNTSPEDIDRMAASNIKVYKRRWYILIIFTLLNTTGNILWNTWPPIQETCQLVFGWDKTNVLIIGALQALGSIISIVPSAWLLDTKGLRFGSVMFHITPNCGCRLRNHPVPSPSEDSTHHVCRIPHFSGRSRRSKRGSFSAVRDLVPATRADDRHGYRDTCLVPWLSV
ncbi:hypothetical protein OS493_021026 [Desmophyllum pertusum]|uniref:Uncharacterized protein n=1 Tax=Desmophyllum pertusum TaxID=174260 RepID=A0A9X0A031_9CNID|nr:hypothetical protein OS493_021026 [Desmophyllum pertusum]